MRIIHESSTYGSEVTVEVVGIVIILIAVILTHHVVGKGLVGDSDWIGAVWTGACAADLARWRDVGWSWCGDRSNNDRRCDGYRRGGN